MATANSFPLFLHDEKGARRAVVRADDGKYKTKELEQEYTPAELAELALKSPERFSPNVTLRAVVQDYLLPTIAYYGGAAEIAYFAQTAEVYRVLGRPATPILPRSSLTMIERHAGRVLGRYDLSAGGFFDGIDPVIKRVVERVPRRQIRQSCLRRPSRMLMTNWIACDQDLQSIDPTWQTPSITAARRLTTNSMAYDLDLCVLRCRAMKPLIASYKEYLSSCIPTKICKSDTSTSLRCWLATARM